MAAYSNVFWNFNTVTDMPTQTDINNMLIGFKASLSTSHDYLDVYHAYVDIYYTNFTIRDYKGNNHIYALGGVGKGVKFYSYAE
ncbi:hypothetical protein COV16_02580 [Candidatus Woesearchaeota archaeon CG10_big_fil_rev_8_21_14_0_10_34_8]|nr:MAG: hypothetical protein COV16_02580 [Candidatus Woesearchaeota archaeon CG10_big_fil_rev_8_21_14_0_10_34_8]